MLKVSFLKKIKKIIFKPFLLNFFILFKKKIQKAKHFLSTNMKNEKLMYENYNYASII
jgi:hypothetical protein